MERDAEEIVIPTIVHKSEDKAVMRRLAVALIGAAVIGTLPASAADIILNEYNAVGSTSMLDGGKGIDSYFGRITGNGGNWFELLVVNDHVDVRGWTLAWAEDEPVTNGAAGQTTKGSLTLSQDSIWSNLRAGSIVTFIETADGAGSGKNTSTDTSYDPATGDWWINVSTRQEATKGATALVTTTTNDGVAGDFSTGKSDWTLTISNPSNVVVFGPVGEGAVWNGDKVSGEEGGSLEGPKALATNAETLGAWAAIAPSSEDYDDTSSTSFGAANVSFNSTSSTFSAEQAIEVLRALVVSPIGGGDFNGDGQLTVEDINSLTSAVLAGSTDAKYDVDKDGRVNGDDRQAWVESVKKTYFGDADLDGVFDSADFVTVLIPGQYEDEVAGNSSWETGDWDGDRDFTSADFVTALIGGGYEAGPRAAVAMAVPEPASMMLSLLSLFGLIGVGRRR